MIYETQVWFSFEKGKSFDFEKGRNIRGMIVAPIPSFSLVQLRCKERIPGFQSIVSLSHLDSLVFGIWSVLPSPTPSY